jgi:hypothetical protein
MTPPVLLPPAVDGSPLCRGHPCCIRTARPRKRRALAECGPTFVGPARPTPPPHPRQPYCACSQPQLLHALLSPHYVVRSICALSSAAGPLSRAGGNSHSTAPRSRPNPASSRRPTPDRRPAAFQRKRGAGAVLPHLPRARPRAAGVRAPARARPPAAGARAPPCNHNPLQDGPPCPSACTAFCARATLPAAGAPPLPRRLCTLTVPRPARGASAPGLPVGGPLPGCAAPPTPRRACRAGGYWHRRPCLRPRGCSFSHRPRIVAATSSPPRPSPCQRPHARRCQPTGSHPAWGLRRPGLGLPAVATPACLLPFRL